MLFILSRKMERENVNFFKLCRWDYRFILVDFD